MAYNDSGKLSPSQSYQLGNYTFELHSNYDGDEEVTGIVARMTYNGETKIGGIDIEGQVTVKSWSVEANETEATVYAVVNIPKGDWHRHTSELNTSPLSKPIASGAIHVEREYSASGGRTYKNITDFSGNGICYGAIGGPNFVYLLASSGPGTVTNNWKTINEREEVIQRGSSSHNLNRNFTYNSKTVYYGYGIDAFSAAENVVLSPLADANFYNSSYIGEIAWTMVYGTVVNPEYTQEEQLVGRFAIDLETATGGPGGGWDEPGDTGDPSYTLNVNVTGATAGTHDAAAMPSAPADQPVYGSGGAGGNGGGGGAGASTVIIYYFATDKAGTVNQEATAQGPGTGGPGGKGGKGGDGCILIFY